MSSGRIHDRITLWSLPFVASLTFGQTRSGNLTLLVTSGFLFSGLMFGPDLDTYSRQYQRWGWLRWIWLPYQQSLHHRSFLSHGPLIGTGLRLIYLALWIILLGMATILTCQFVWSVHWSWQQITQLILHSLQYQSSEWIALFVGLELGSMSHVFADWSSSAYKRFKSKGWRGLIPQTPKPKKRKRQSSKSKS